MNLFMSTLSTTKMTSRNSGIAFFKIINSIPSLVPDKCDSAQPIRGIYNSDNFEPGLKYWGTCFLWKRTRPLVEGGVFSSHDSLNGLHSTTFAYSSELDIAPTLATFLEVHARAFGSDHAFLHSLAAPEIAAGVKSNSISAINQVSENYALAISTHELVRYIPDLYWANVFGKPYLDLFGREKLLSAPAYLVKEIAPDCIWIQLSPSIEDMQNDYSRIIEARKAIKEHLNPTAFFQLDLPPDHKYDVPDFGF